MARYRANGRGRPVLCGIVLCMAPPWYEISMHPQRNGCAGPKFRTASQRPGSVQGSGAEQNLIAVKDNKYIENVLYLPIDRED